MSAALETLALRAFRARSFRAAGFLGLGTLNQQQETLWSIIAYYSFL